MADSIRLPFCRNDRAAGQRAPEVASDAVLANVRVSSDIDPSRILRVEHNSLEANVYFAQPLVPFERTDAVNSRFDNERFERLFAGRGVSQSLW